MASRGQFTRGVRSSCRCLDEDADEINIVYVANVAIHVTAADPGAELNNLELSISRPPELGVDQGCPQVKSAGQHVHHRADLGLSLDVTVRQRVEVLLEPGRVHQLLGVDAAKEKLPVHHYSVAGNFLTWKVFLDERPGGWRPFVVEMPLAGDRKLMYRLKDLMQARDALDQLHQPAPVGAGWLDNAGRAGQVEYRGTHRHLCDLHRHR